MENRSAGFLPRLGAFALDFIPILGYILITLVIGITIVTGTFKGQSTGAYSNPVLFDAIAFVTVVLPVILYFGIQESSVKRATWGKRRMGLIVVTQNGGRVSFGRALLRSAIKFLPWQMAHTCIFNIPGWPFAVQDFPAWVMTGFIVMYVIVAIYLLSLLIKPYRTPYDWIAGTVVAGFRDRVT
jgi:uncharacterized RDD family membrane protein YckC